MYDLSGSDTGREWIEIYNSGPETVDVSPFKFLENSGASNHGLTLNQGSETLSSGAYAVIASDPTKFLLDFPGFSGNLFKASFSMNNTGSTLLIRNGDLVVQDEVTYASTQGANGDGNSLQKSGTTWVAGTPTPGLQNISTGNSPPVSTTTPPQIQEEENGSQNTGNGASAHSSPAPLSNAEETILFEISAGRDRLTTVGNLLIFQARMTKGKEVSESSITYNWSFGDGTMAVGNLINHTYKFPGDYVVVLNATGGDKQAVSRIEIKVILPQLSVSKVQGGVEVFNKSKNEINLEGWTLSGSNKSFIFPKDTLILSNRKVTFADSVTNVIGEKIELLNPLGTSLASLDNSEPSPPQINSISTTTLNEIFLLQTKLDEARKELARIMNVPKKEVVEIKSVVPVSITIEKPDIVETQVANAIEVFESSPKKGIVSRMFTWPIKGINWVTRLFVEE